MKNCQIKENSNGVVYDVENPQGKSSTLYKQALLKTDNNIKKSLNIWATAYSDEYISTNGEWKTEPKLKDVLSFLSGVNSQNKKLSIEEIDELKNNTTSIPFNNLEDLYTQLKYLYKDGVFSISKETLRKTGLYEKAEIQAILTDVDIQNKLKQTADKIKAEYLYNQNDIDSNLVNYETNPLTRIANTNQIVGIGKFKIENPFKIDNQIKELIGGIKDKSNFENILEQSAPEQIKEKYFNNESYAKEFFDHYSELDRIPLLEENSEGELNPVQENNILSFTKQALVLGQNAGDLNKTVDFLRGIPQDVWDNSPIEVEDMLLRAEDYAADLGIDIVGLSEQTASYYDFMNLLDEVSFLTKKAQDGVAEERDIVDFADRYNAVFTQNLEPKVTAQKVSATNMGRKLFKVSTIKSEEQLFNEDNLLKADKDIYQRVSKIEDLETLYDMTMDLIQNNPNIVPQQALYPSAFTGQLFSAEKASNKSNRGLLMEDFKRWVQQQGDEALTLYKVAFQHPLKFAKEKVRIPNYEIQDAQYLQTDFIADFAKIYIQEKQKDSMLFQKVLSHFSLNDSGITLNDTDPFSIQEIKLFLPKKGLLSKLNDYISLSKDKNLKFMGTETGDSAGREFYMNNPDQLDDIAMQYETSEDGNNIAIANNMDTNWVKVNNEIYERVKDYKNLTIYQKLPSINNPYFNVTGININIDDNINLKQFDDLAQALTDIYRIEKKYSSKEEAQINKEIDDCR